MDMKRILLGMMLGFCVLASMAQSSDLMRIYTDKDCYLAGEKLWIKVNVDNEALPGNAISRVAYVEICDTAQVYVQGKVALQQGAGWACIHLPQTMHSGVYQLTAYTRYMRNCQSESFPRKYIAVLNTLGSSEKDGRVMNDLDSFAGNASMSSDMGMKGDKSRYGHREKVSLSWTSSLADAKELVLSVVRKDCAVNLPVLDSQFLVQNNGASWLPECEGHIVTAKIEGEEMPAEVLTQLSCVGKEMKLFEGQKKGNGIYQFFTYGVNDCQDVVLTALANDGKTYRMEMETPFAEKLPDNVPNLICQYEDSTLIDRSVALQLSQAMPKMAFQKDVEEMIYGRLPDKTYNLDEYVRFNTVQECIVEFVMGISITKENGKNTIRMLDGNSKSYNLFPVLVLVDGVAFNDHSEVLGYNARQLHYIHQYRGDYVLGDSYYGGILSLITHRGMLTDIRMHEHMQMVSYEFPQDRPDFDMPIYDNEEKLQSRRPDFRHTMYWNPSVEGKTGVEFYTSDLEGEYEAVLKGIDAEGKKIELKWEFQVKR